MKVNISVYYVYFFSFAIEVFHSCFVKVRTVLTFVSSFSDLESIAFEVTSYLFRGFVVTLQLVNALIFVYKHK